MAAENPLPTEPGEPSLPDFCETGMDSVRQTVKDFEAIGADELIFNTTLPVDQISQLADAVL